MVWRPITAGKVTLTEVKTGVCDLLDIIKINSLLDHEIALQNAAMNKT
jgi:hypothetical protein